MNLALEKSIEAEELKLKSLRNLTEEMNKTEIIALLDTSKIAIIFPDLAEVYGYDRPIDISL